MQSMGDGLQARQEVAGRAKVSATAIKISGLSEKQWGDTLRQFPSRVEVLKEENEALRSRERAIARQFGVVVVREGGREGVRQKALIYAKAAS